MNTKQLSSSDHVERRSQSRDSVVSSRSSHSTKGREQYIPNSKQGDLDFVSKKLDKRRTLSTRTSEEGASSESGLDNPKKAPVSSKWVDPLTATPSRSKEGIRGRLRGRNSISELLSPRKKEGNKVQKQKKKKEKKKGRSRSRSLSSRDSGDFHSSSGSLDVDSAEFEDVLGIEMPDEAPSSKKKKKKSKKGKKKDRDDEDALYYEGDLPDVDPARSVSPRRNGKKNVLTRIARSLSPAANRKKVMAKRAARKDNRSKSPGRMIKTLNLNDSDGDGEDDSNLLQRFSSSFGSLGNLPGARARTADKYKKDFDWDEERNYSKDELKYLEQCYKEYEQMEL